MCLGMSVHTHIDQPTCTLAARVWPAVVSSQDANCPFFVPVCRTGKGGIFRAFALPVTSGNAITERFIRHRWKCRLMGQVGSSRPWLVLPGNAESTLYLCMLYFVRTDMSSKYEYNV